jgi:hypothetical protein
MDSIGAVYARIPDGNLDQLAAAVVASRAVSHHSSPLGVLAGEPAQHAFAVVDRWGRSDNMPLWGEDPALGLAVELIELSRRVGDVIALYEIDEGATLGLYGAWKDGQLVRDLQWADFQWSVVEGEPQVWEAPLFAPAALERALAAARDDGRDEQEVRDAFAAGRIVAGQAWPMPEGLALHIRNVCRGPAFGFTPWPRRQDLVDALRQ